MAGFENEGTGFLFKDILDVKGCGDICDLLLHGKYQPDEAWWRHSSRETTNTRPPVRVSIENAQTNITGSTFATQG
jgi:hypothetical protein